MSQVASAENVIALHGYAIRTHSVERVHVGVGDEPDVSEIVQVHSVTPPGKPQEILYQSENHGDSVRVAKLLQIAEDAVARSQDPRKVISAAIGVMNSSMQSESQVDEPQQPETESEAPE